MYFGMRWIGEFAITESQGYPHHLVWYMKGRFFITIHEVGVARRNFTMEAVPLHNSARLFSGCANREPFFDAILPPELGSWACTASAKQEAERYNRP